MMQRVIVKDRASNIDFMSMARDAMQPWTTAYESWRSGVADMLDRRPAAKGDCCARCGPDPCQCRCCVADSDLLVEARVGERRIIPITIENHWRREREIELELSSWTTLSDGIVVQGQIMTPTSFTLKPCGEERIIIGVEIKGSGKDGSTDGNRIKIDDVKGCAVSYADLRIKGCDLRPVRIAVAVLPRDCDDYVIDCQCGCC
jgi:hypothetical protein